MQSCTCMKRLSSVKSNAGYYGNDTELPFLCILQTIIVDLRAILE